ncbi:MAG TPA: acetylornithine deacetylase [Saprospiraceae bacterium]|nr:acetylornithine deacetylase [Saprospiraceae bacterium]
MIKTVQQILTDLVSFPVFGGDSNIEIAEYISGILQKENIDYEWVENKTEKKASIHCRIGPPKDGGIILSGHTDVVPVEGQAWNSNPFVLTEKNDGRLYARGSCDMKGFIATCLANISFLKQLPLQKPVYFAFSYDEEIGCLAAPELARSILSTYKEKPSYAVIGEPSLLQPITGQKGICVIETQVKGSEGHSSRINEEVSAIHVAADLILWIERKMDQLINENQLDLRFTPPHSTLHVGTIDGGIATNVIADRCRFKWDIRVIPKNSIENILNDFNHYCRRKEMELRTLFPEFSIKSVLHHPPVPALDTPDHFSIVSWIKNLTGHHTTGTVAYAAEAGQFAEAGFETIICGPGSIEQAHRANEFISKDQLLKGMEFVKKIGFSLT